MTRKRVVCERLIKPVDGLVAQNAALASKARFYGHVWGAAKAGYTSVIKLALPPAAVVLMLMVFSATRRAGS